MEEPIRFDIYGVVSSEGAQEAVQGQRSLNPGLSEIEARKRVNRSRVGAEVIVLAAGIPWSRVLELRAGPPAWVTNLEVYQEGYSPTQHDSLGYCEKHQFHYGGCLGCHVCSSFYER